MTEMEEGNPLKPIHDTLGKTIDTLKQLTMTLIDVKEQLHLVDGSQTTLEDNE